jgi:hypothetical protein
LFGTNAPGGFQYRDDFIISDHSPSCSGHFRNDKVNIRNGPITADGAIRAAPRTSLQASADKSVSAHDQGWEKQ